MREVAQHPQGWDWGEAVFLQEELGEGVLVDGQFIEFLVLDLVVSKNQSSKWKIGQVFEAVEAASREVNLVQVGTFVKELLGLKRNDWGLDAWQVNPSELVKGLDSNDSALDTLDDRRFEIHGCVGWMSGTRIKVYNVWKIKTGKICFRLEW